MEWWWVAVVVSGVVVGGCGGEWRVVVSGEWW